MAAKRKLEKGLVIFVDNYRVMHGRTGFDGNRTVSGIAFLTLISNAYRWMIR